MQRPSLFQTRPLAEHEKATRANCAACAHWWYALWHMRHCPLVTHAVRRGFGHFKRVLHVCDHCVYRDSITLSTREVWIRAEEFADDGEVWTNITWFTWFDVLDVDEIYHLKCSNVFLGTCPEYPKHFDETYYQLMRRRDFDAKLEFRSNHKVMEAAVDLMLRNAPIKNLALYFASPLKYTGALGAAIVQNVHLETLTVYGMAQNTPVPEFRANVQTSLSMRRATFFYRRRRASYEFNGRIALLTILMRPSRNKAFEWFKRRDGDHAILLDVFSFLS